MYNESCIVSQVQPKGMVQCNSCTSMKEMLTTYFIYSITLPHINWDNHKIHHFQREWVKLLLKSIESLALIKVLSINEECHSIPPSSISMTAPPPPSQTIIHTWHGEWRGCLLYKNFSDQNLQLKVTWVCSIIIFGSPTREWCGNCGKPGNSSSWTPGLMQFGGVLWFGYHL